MSNQVIISKRSRYEKNDESLHVFKSRTQCPGVVFAAKLPDTSITAYKSGKVLFQGAGAEREAARWGTAEVKARSAAVKTKGDLLPDRLQQLSVLGSDETGTGDFFGPVTVAACFVRADQVELVRELGVKDSKQLTDDLMRKIAPDLQASAYL